MNIPRLFLFLCFAVAIASAFPTGLCRTAIVTSTPILPGYVCASGGQMITITCFNTSVSYPICVDGSGVNGTDLASDITYFPVVPSDFDNLNQTTVDIALNLLGARRPPTYFGGNFISVTALNASSFLISFTGALSSAGVGFSLVANGSGLSLNVIDAGPGVFISQIGNDITIESDIAFSSSGAGGASIIRTSSTSSIEFNELSSISSNLIIVNNGAGLITFEFSANPSFTSLTLSTPLAIASGGTGTGSLTAYGIVTVNGSGTALSSTPLTNGQLLIGSTGSAPVAGTISGTTSQISVATGPGTITLSTPADFVAPGTIQDTTGMYLSTSATVSAAGATQGTATALTASNNVVTTVAASTGVALPTPAKGGLMVSVENRGANTLNVYPASGGAIDAAGANVAVTLAPNAAATYIAASTTQWYTVSVPLVSGSTSLTVSYGNGRTSVSAVASPSLFSNTLSLTQNNPGVGVYVTMVPTGAGSVTVPANLLSAGSKITASVDGYFSSGGGTAFTFRLLKDAAVIYTSPSTANVGAGTNTRLSVKADWNIFTDGAGGTMLGSGVMNVDTASCAIASITTTGYDTTSSHVFGIEFAFSTLNVANTFTVTSFRLSASTI